MNGHKVRHDARAALEAPYWRTSSPARAWPGRATGDVEAYKTARLEAKAAPAR